jgi:hypothetical protein
MYSKFSLVLPLFFGVQSIWAACDNACSGHGTCSYKDICTCWQNWQMGDEDGGDCSDRQCPFELAWVDSPDRSGKFHKYAECAGRGVCDRGTGECQCFEGYSGKGCQRTTCPNDCSGHGTCQFIEDLYFAENFGSYYDAQVYPNTKTTMANGDEPVTFSPVGMWDSKKTMGCECDPLWTDADCSRRMCPKGTDILHERTNTGDTLEFQEQTIAFNMPTNTGPDEGGEIWDALADLAGTSFAITFKTTLNETFTTYPIIFTSGRAIADLAGDIELALEALPNGVIDDVEVTGSTATVAISETEGAALPFSGDQYLQISFVVTFQGATVQGPQNLLSIVDYTCGTGCTPKLVGIPLRDKFPLSYVKETMVADYNNYECGRRGKCDYESGLCTCFDGYTGESCAVQTALI